MTKTIMILAIAGAFVAGMLVSGTSAMAVGPPGDVGIFGQILVAVQGNDVGIQEINDKLALIQADLATIKDGGVINPGDIGEELDGIIVDVDELGVGEDELMQDLEDIGIDVDNLGVGEDELNDKLDTILDELEILNGGIFGP